MEDNKEKTAENSNNEDTQKNGTPNKESEDNPEVVPLIQPTEENKSKEQIMNTPDLSHKPTDEIKIIISDESETNKNISNTLIEAIKSYTEEKRSSKFIRHIRNALDNSFGKNWNVFVGEHFFGVCLFEEETLVQVKVDNLMILVFKTFVYKN